MPSSLGKRRIVLVVAIVVIAAALLYAYGNLLKIRNALLQAAREPIQKTLEQALGFDVGIGSITGKNLNEVVLSDLSFSDGSGADVPVFSAGRVEVSYSLFDVITKRKSIAQAITGILLIEPDLRIELPPDFRLSEADTDFQLESAGGFLDRFQGSISVKDGRCEIIGIPGLGRPVVLSGITGAAVFTGFEIAGEIRLLAGDENRTRIAATGGYDLMTHGLTCDIGLSGPVSGDLLRDVSGVLDALLAESVEPGEDSQGIPATAREILSILDAANLHGGTVNIEAHIRPEPDGGSRIRGNVNIAGAEFSAPAITLDSITPDAGEYAGELRDVDVRLSLALDFQLDNEGLAYQGMSRLDILSLEWHDEELGFGKTAAQGKAEVEFWKNPEDEFLSFEGDVALDTPFLSAGEALKKAVELEDSSLKLEGPARINLALAGRRDTGIETYGTVRMDKAVMSAFEVFPGMKEISGDIEGSFTFRSFGKALTGYEGQVRLISGYADSAFPEQGIELLQGELKGALGFSKEEGENLTYTGFLDVVGSGVVLDYKLLPDKPSGEEDLSGEIRLSEGALEGRFEFRGEFPGIFKYDGVLKLRDGLAEVDGTIETARLEVSDMRAGGDIIIRGELPGTTEYGGKISLSEGAAKVYEGLPWLKHAEGLVSCAIDFVANSEGSLKYSGDVNISKATLEASDAASGIEEFSGEGSLNISFRGEGDTVLQYEGSGRIEQGNLVASEIAEGIRRLEGPITGTLGFKGKHQEDTAVELIISTGRCAVEAEEFGGFIRSLSGNAEGWVRFVAQGPNVQGYTGEVMIENGSFVADEAMPGLVKARGLGDLDIKFSSSGEGDLTYYGKATVHSADISTKHIYQGIDSLDGNATSEFSFRSTGEGIEYDGVLNVASGTVVLKDLIEGFHRLDGDVVLDLKFQGGASGGSFQGDAVVSRGRLKAGKLLKGIESIEGDARLEISFSGGSGLTPSYNGTLSLSEALFSASDVIDGVKSLVGKARSTIRLESRSDGAVSLKGTVDLSSASFAADRIYPGIRELSGNGAAHLSFERIPDGSVSFEGKVLIMKGILGLEAVSELLDNIVAEIDFDGESVDIKGMTGDFGRSRFEASGLLYLGQTPEIDITVRSRDLAFEELGEIVVAGAPLSVSGNAVLDIAIKGFYPDLDFTGEVSFSGVEIQHARLPSPASNVEGVVRLLGTSISTDGLIMMLGDSAVEVEGSITDLGNPSFDINVYAGDIGLADVKDLFNLDIPGDMKGRGEFSVNIAGPFEDLWAEGRFRVSDLSFEVLGKPVEATEAKGRFSYGKNGITLSDTVVAAMGGEISVSGVALFKQAEDGLGQNPWTWLSLELDELPAKEAASYFAWEDIITEGVLSGKVVLEAERDFWSVQGACTVQDGSLNVYSFDNLKVDFTADEEKVIIDGLVSEGPDGNLTAKGTVYDNADFELQVAAQAVSLEKLSDLLEYPEVTGTGDFLGTVSSKEKALSIDGLLELTNPAIGEIELDSTVGRVSFKDSVIRLFNTSVVKGDATGQISGVIELGGEYPEFDLVATVNALPVDDLASVLGLGEIPLRGALSGKAAFSGTTKSPEAGGEVRLTSGEIHGIKLDDLRTGFAYSEDTLNIEDSLIEMGGIRISAAGNITREGKLSLDVRGEDFDLSNLPVEIPDNPVKGGRAGFTGRITGQLSNVHLEGQIVAEDVQVLDAVLHDVTCHMELGNDDIRLTQVVIKDGLGQVMAEGNIGLNEDRTINLTLTIEEIDSKTALGVIRPGKRDPIEGRISGKVVVTGDLREPSFELRLKSDSLSIAGVPFEKAALDARMVGDSVNVELLQLSQARGGYFEAAGSLGQSAPMSLAASARDFDVSIFSSVAGWKSQLAGNADLAVRAEGELEDPSMALSLRIRDGSVDRFGFDLLNARMTFNNGVITIEEGEILQGHHKATLSGRIPVSKDSLDAIGITSYSSDEELNVNLTMTKANLGLITIFWPQVEWAEGTTDIDLYIAGTIQSPRLYGYAIVEDGTLKLFPITDVFRDIDCRVEFEGTEARIEKFSCTLGGGGVNVSGGVAFLDEQEGLSLDLSLKTQDAMVNTGIFRSLVNSDIYIDGPVHHPLISGRISLVKAILSPDTWSFEQKLSFDADLALTVDVEGDVRLRTRIMDIPASGSLRVGGTLKEPELSGRMEARRGWFAYFGNEFTVRQASAEFTEHQGFMPRIEVDAETVSGDIRVFLGLRGVLPDNLGLELSSSPPLTHDEILALLNYPGAVTRILTGDVEGAFREEITKIFEQELRLRVSGGIGRIFEDLLALDEFRIQRSASNQLTLRIGKYLVDELYLSYEKGLGPEASDLFRFDYLLGPGVVFTGTLDDKGERIFGIEARLRF